MTMMQKSVTKCRENQKARLNLKIRLGLDKKSLIFIDQNRKPALFASSNKQSARAFWKRNLHLVTQAHIAS